MIKNNKKISCLLALACLIGALGVTKVYAYKVQPMVAEMEPVGRNAQLTLRVENNDSEPLTLEMVPLKVLINSSGNIEYIPADDDLLIIPVTTVLQAGRSQAVMVRYLGEPDISQSQAYSIGFRQLPVTVSGQSATKLSLAVNFNTLVNVVPANAKAILAVENISFKDNNWQVTINNSGNRYVRLSNTQWRVSDGVKSLQLTKEQLSELVSGSLILPNSSRTLTMQPIETLSMDKLNIEIEMVK
ncbi:MULTISPECIES: fimbrial biogenesis chaperone [Shewanella]|uniref:Molecular chaperone n=1 Tax=Shewanella psychromarinicola TaxID=2487742 RepID=A0A3N4E8X3_9GAMM|nr:molecular chaperone [Shewanella psychromarinicola]AZG36672.1 molecular chaperone [Shewanella psychromarinicola]MCL1082319.1 molecular chaperone [Shewanella psychromarinicola]RPA34523.1 molecular chaperone [Shewanella psychromarinicola]